MTSFTKVPADRRVGFPAVLLLILAAGAALLGSSCDILASTDGVNLPPLISGFPAERTFNSFNFKTSSYLTWYSVPSDLMYTGTYCAVYVEKGQPVDEGLAEQIGMEFDQNVYGKIRDDFAFEEDVDFNEKIIILMLDIPDDYDSSSNPAYMAGYFYGEHMLLNIEQTNRADMLFMDTDPGLSNPEDFNITLAHEFQHMVNFSEKYIRGGGKQQDTWINEGLSAGAEYVYLEPFQNDWKIGYYNADEYHLIRNGEYFLTWAMPGNLANYSTVYLFFQWLRIQANGTGIYKDILSSAYNDYRAVEAAAASRMYGGTWKEYLRDWFLANALNLPGKHGYKGEITTTPKFLTAGEGDSITLAPGEGFYYAKTTDEYSPAVSAVEYAAFDTTDAVELTAPFTKERLLAFNTVGVVGTAPSNTAPLPPSASFVSTLGSAPAAAASKSLAPPRTRFPIDAVFDASPRGPLPRRPGR